ncbi:MAG: glycosyltransferase family 2 protein, partial [Actinomycetota bacterium]
PVVRALRRRYTVPAAPAARPTVVVVLPTRGRTALPVGALDDVLDQTFTDWRLVVVDDGGDPGAVDELVARHRGRLAGRATVVHHRRALSPGAAANRGLRVADSEFVVLHDAGDPWHPTVLQRAVAHLEDPLVTDDGVLVPVESPPAATAATGPGGACELQGGPARPGPAALSLVDALDGAPAVPGTFVYRRAVHGVLGDYDETLAGAPDWEFALRFLETFTAGLLAGRPFPLRGRPGEEPGARGRDELLVHERHLRQWTAENGIGLPLYVSRAVGRRTERLAQGLEASQALTRELLDVVRAQSAQLEQLERAVAEKGFTAFWRRLWRRLGGR